MAGEPMTLVSSGTSSRTALFAATWTRWPILRWPEKPLWPGDENVIAQFGGTSDAHLRDEQAMLPDFHVVSDHHQVVDLGPLAYHGFAQGRPIDRRPGPDLDVVLDPDDADLRNLVMLALVHGETVAIGADDDARVDDAAAANARAIVNDDVGIDDRIVPERRAGFDRDTLENCDVVPDDNIFSNRGERADGHVRPQPGA